jgi:hypothetical protein
MTSYYVNKNVQLNGDHEVHEQGCVFMPSGKNSEYLGDFENCRDAVREAEKTYSQVNGCSFCSSACHTQ